MTPLVIWLGLSISNALVALGGSICPNTWFLPDVNFRVGTIPSLG